MMFQRWWMYKYTFQTTGTVIQEIYQISKLKKERKEAIQNHSFFT